jgi:hypothetical protein
MFMRKFLTLLVLVSATCACAQVSVYHPMPTANAKWCLTLVGGTSCAWTYQYTEFINGDTTVGANTYHKLYASGYDYCSGVGPVTYFYNQYKGAFREDPATKKLYLLKNNSTGYEDLIFDFSLQAGDTLQVGNPSYVGPKVAITAIDSILVGSSYRKRFWTNQAFSGTTGGNGDSLISVIEGIGSTEGMLCEFLCEGIESGSVMKAFMQNNSIDYSKNAGVCDFGAGVDELHHLVSIAPNPTSGTVVITCPQTPEQVRLLSVLGTELKRARINGAVISTDLSAYENGVYLLEVTVAGMKMTEKLILNH